MLFSPIWLALCRIRVRCECNDPIETRTIYVNLCLIDEQLRGPRNEHDPLVSPRISVDRFRFRATDMSIPRENPPQNTLNWSAAETCVRPYVNFNPSRLYDNTGSVFTHEPRREIGNPKSESRTAANSTLRIFQVPARTPPGSGVKSTPWTRVTTVHAATAASPWRRTWRGICATSAAWRPSISARTATSPRNSRRTFTRISESIIPVRPCASGGCTEPVVERRSSSSASFFLVRFQPPFVTREMQENWQLPLCEKEKAQ